MKNTLKYNRPLAAAALVIIICLSLVLGINRTVNSFENKVEKLYESTKVLSDLKDLSGYATKIMAGGKTAGIDVSALETALTELGATVTDPTAVSEWASEVYTQSSLVYNDTYYSGKYDDVSTLTAYMTEIESTMMRLKHNDSYNNAASKYNKALESFPASIFTLGKKSAVIFG